MNAMTQKLYQAGRTFVRFYAFLMLRLDIHHHIELPPGPKLFVANHPSATDPFLIHLISRQQVSVMITEKAFQVPLLGRYMRRVRQIPVPLEQGSTALTEARAMLEKGHSVAIFIEGLVSPAEGGFNPPRTGAARLALSAGVPVVPVGIYLPRERTIRITSNITGKKTSAPWYLRGPYSVTVGRHTHYEGDMEDHRSVAELTGEFMHAIRKLAHESEQRMRKRKSPPGSPMDIARIWKSLFPAKARSASEG
jgi:1-acyl-sn-glycerol-3-phosphate acyltransferase